MFIDRKAEPPDFEEYFVYRYRRYYRLVRGDSFQLYRIRIPSFWEYLRGIQTCPGTEIAVC